MAEQLPTRPLTVSVGFDDANHNELEAAGRTARHCQTSHHAHVVHPRLEEVLDALVGAFDEPFADSSAVPTFYLCRTARQHVTVALSGDGGDESFAGYDFRYQAQRIEGWLRDNAPDAFRVGAARVSPVFGRDRRRFRVRCGSRPCSIILPVRRRRPITPTCAS
jgi:asparagine synthase (glutamine-hydrolysing)